MDKLYLQGNYIVIEQGAETFVFSKYFCTYYETSLNVLIQGNLSAPTLRTCSILIADIPNYYDETGLIAYTVDTFKDFLRQNTGFKTPPGGSGGVPDGDKGDISVTGAGSIWTIDNNAVTDAKINDVNASKVTTDSTHRFVTDAEKTSWNASNPLIDLIEGVNITGTLTMSKTASILIPANSITAPTVIELVSRAIRISGTGSTIYHQIYINTSDSMTGATLLGVFSSLTSTNYFSQGIRQIFINTATNQLTVVNAGATIPTDYINTGANTVLTFNPANNYYLICAVQLFNVGDTARAQFLMAKKYA
jgi:hypothetical protein